MIISHQTGLSSHLTMKGSGTERGAVSAIVSKLLHVDKLVEVLLQSSVIVSAIAPVAPLANVLQH